MGEIVAKLDLLQTLLSYAGTDSVLSRDDRQSQCNRGQDALRVPINYHRFSPYPTNRSASRGAVRSACSSISATTSSIDHSRLSIPAAIAGEVRSVLWTRTKLYQRAYSATVCAWFSSFLLNALVSRVNRRMLIQLRLPGARPQSDSDGISCERAGRLAGAGVRRLSPMICATAGTRRSAAVMPQLRAKVPAKTIAALNTAGKFGPSIANCSQTMNR